MFLLSKALLVAESENVFPNKCKKSVQMKIDGDRLRAFFWWLDEIENLFWDLANFKIVQNNHYLLAGHVLLTCQSW